MTVSPAKTETVFWQQPVPELLKQLNATASGLTSGEAADRLKQAGPNLLRPQQKRALVLQFLSRFKNPLVLILLIASAVSAFTAMLPDHQCHRDHERDPGFYPGAPCAVAT